eukprot:UN24039
MMELKNKMETWINTTSVYSVTKIFQSKSQNSIFGDMWSNTSFIYQ